MAKLKEKINELKTKYGITEDAAREVLALHDGDIQEASALLTQEQNKVIEWNKFWSAKVPQIEALVNEYDSLRTQLDAIKAATGVQPNTESKTIPNATEINTKSSNIDDVEKRIYQNFSQVQEDLWNIQRQHFENYKTIPDLAPIKQLIEEQKMTPWSAYQKWVEPMESERKEKELRERVTAEITEKLRNEATRNGVNSYLLSTKNSVTGEEVTSPLDEVLRDTNEKEAVKAASQGTNNQDKTGPSEFELLTDFVQSMRSGRSGVAH